MNVLYFLPLLFISFLAHSVDPEGRDPDDIKCAACVVILGLVEQHARVSSATIETTIGTICADITSISFFRYPCSILIDLIPEIDKDYLANIEPEKTCSNLKFCLERHKKCSLWKGWPLMKKYTPIKTKYGLEQKLSKFENPLDWWNTISNPYSNLGGSFLPFEDADGDGYSGVFASLRGYHWRGRDCNVIDADTHPGIATTSDYISDSNCNGIQGFSITKFSTYEKLFCSESEPRGIIALGDSVGERFHFPPIWLTPHDISKRVYQSVLSVVEDEVGWPECSWATGFHTEDACPPSDLIMKSIYQRLRERNRCNYRDFQNVCANGIDSVSLFPLTQTIRRRDVPATVFISLVGNDICRIHPGYQNMTTPKVFEENIKHTLSYLNDVLPADSSVVFIGLVDGRVLYDTLHKLVHPLGVVYSDLYSWMECMVITPCWGYLNSDPSVRDETYKHTEALNEVYEMMVKKAVYPNLSLHYYSFDVAKIMSMWSDPTELVEPVDGFHPTGTCAMLLAEDIWNDLEKNFPKAIGKVNPFNEDIKKEFKDQGGEG